MDILLAKLIMIFSLAAIVFITIVFIRDTVKANRKK